MAYEQMSINYEVAKRLRVYREHFSELFTSTPAGLTHGATIGLFMDLYEHLAEAKLLPDLDVLQGFADGYPRKGRTRRSKGEPLLRGVPPEDGSLSRKQLAKLRGHEFRQLTAGPKFFGRCVRCAAGLDLRPEGEIYTTCAYADGAPTSQTPEIKAFLAKSDVDWEQDGGDLPVGPSER